MEPIPTKTGTTTLGIICSDGVVIAADRKATAYYVDSRNEKKVHPLNDRIVVTTAGAVGDLQFLVRIMKAEIALYEIREGLIPVESATTLLSNIMHSNRYYPFYAQILIGGYDDQPHLFSVDAWGGAVSGENIFVTGSGGPIALGLLEAEYKEGMSCKDAAILAARAIRTARERDPYSGGKGLDIAIVDKNGIRMLTQEDIEKLR